jgi:hypothetical protein
MVFGGAQKSTKKNLRFECASLSLEDFWSDLDMD